MLVTKTQPYVNDNFLWQQETTELNDDIFNQEHETTMMFGIFYLDELIKDQDQIILKSQLSELSSMLEPWNEAFPWNGYNGVSLEIRESLSGEYYIFGSLQVGDNARDEECLVLSILLNFSRHAGPCTFIKVCDTDGEFILMEANEIIPAELEFPVSNNRIWITMGKISYIPITFYYDRGLSKYEALSFLKKDSSKVSYLPDLESNIRKNFLKVFPYSTLNKLKCCKTIITDSKVAEILKYNPKLVSLALTHFMTSSFETIPTEKHTEDGHMIDVIAPQSHLALVKKFVDLTSTDQELNNKLDFYSDTLGSVLVDSIHHMIDNDILTLSSNNRLKPKALLSCLQEHKIITEDFQIANVKWDILNPDDDVELNATSLDTLKTNLLSFLNDESDLKGIINDNSDERNVNGDAHVDNEQESFLEKDSDISIDEDDFFEFFLKNGLNLADDYIANLRGSYMDSDADKDQIADSELDTLSELHQSLQDVSAECSPIADLVKSLTVDGAPSGPLQTILQNLKKQEP